MIETLLGGLLGGVSRLVPEVLKFVDRNKDRIHELNLQDKALEFEKLRGNQKMLEINAGAEASWNTGAMDTLKAAIESQGQITGVKWADALSASVRPVLTLSFFSLYSLIKIVSLSVALNLNIDWHQAVLEIWNTEDQVLWSSILNFWFIGRIFDKAIK